MDRYMVTKEGRLCLLCNGLMEDLPVVLAKQGRYRASMFSTGELPRRRNAMSRHNFGEPPIYGCLLASGSPSCQSLFPLCLAFRAGYPSSVPVGSFIQPDSAHALFCLSMASAASIRMMCVVP
jgi:hypothetical protein